MEKFLEIDGNRVYYKINGTGFPLVFLHGYLGSNEVWGDFTNKFSLGFQVIVIDIPGHGKSGVISEIHSMDMLAHIVLEILKAEQIRHCVIIGHSMGGYIALACLNLFPERISGLCLLHSHPWADTEQKMADRNREIGLVKMGKKLLIANQNIPLAFNSETINEFSSDVERCIRIASDTPDDGIVAILEGLKIRPDRTGLVSGSKIPILFVFGENDNFIPSLSTQTLNSLRGGLLFLYLKYSGHMGFIEEAGILENCLFSFVSSCIPAESGL